MKITAIALTALLIAGPASASLSAVQEVLDSFGRSITYNVTVEIVDGVAIIRGSLDSHRDAINLKKRILQLEGIDKVVDRLRHPGGDA